MIHQNKNQWVGDGMLSPSDPQYAIVERAFRRGYHHAVAELSFYAKDIPFSVRTYLKKYEQKIGNWRRSFNPNEKPVCPPQIPPYRNTDIHDLYYLAPCPFCERSGHLKHTRKGWAVHCTGTCGRQTQYCTHKIQAVQEWNKR